MLVARKIHKMQIIVITFQNQLVLVTLTGENDVALFFKDQRLFFSGILLQKGCPPSRKGGIDLIHDKTVHIKLEKYSY